MIQEFSSGWMMASIKAIDVRQARRAMCNGTSQYSQLNSMQLVDDILDDSAFPARKQSREYALNHILINLRLV